MTDPQQNHRQEQPASTAGTHAAVPNWANDLEEQVAQIFGRVLQCAPVGPTDDFFLIGGDSGTAVELQILLSDILGQSVPIKDLFDDTTVSGIAATLRRLGAASKSCATLSPVLIPLRERGIGPKLFLVHGRQGVAFVGPQFLSLLGDDLPVYGFQARGLDGVEQPHSTIEEMANDYIAAMRTVQASGPYFLGGLCTGGYVAVVMANMLREAGEQVLPLLLIDPLPPPFRLRPADLADGSPAHDAVAREIDQRLESQQSAGLFNIDLGNSQRKHAVLRTAMAFERALSICPIAPYDGAVHVLGSTDRLGPDGWGNPSKRKSCFSGEVQFYEVAAKHRQVLDVNNKLFKQQLTAILRQVNGLTTRS
jgi:thioesterase domain-containing protein